MLVLRPLQHLSLLVLVLLAPSHSAHRNLPSFPTRRSSDLGKPAGGGCDLRARTKLRKVGNTEYRMIRGFARLFSLLTDRKSTRLNSSHGSISYAVFCLKKKKKNKSSTTTQESGSASREPAT